jgi:hypothetical protein
MQNCAYCPGTQTESTASNTQGLGLCPLCITHRHKDALGANTRHPVRTLIQGVGRNAWERLLARGPAVLTSVSVQADLNRCAMCKVLRDVESLLLVYTNVWGCFEEVYYIVHQGR